MIRTIKAIIDEHGVVRLLEPVQINGNRRALVTILENESEWDGDETAMLSEQALARDWDRTEEDEAWAHLQRRASS